MHSIFLLDQKLKLVGTLQYISDRLRDLKIPHATSQVSDYVSISCGVASTCKDVISLPESLVTHADNALYLAKEQGRDRYVLVD